ncbi:MAG: glycosyltransferase family 39 protein [Nanoarchaeota archaeon]
MKKKSNLKLLFLIFLVALLLRITFFDTSYFFWDETVYIMNSQFIVEGKAPYVQVYDRPILLPLLIAPFYKSEILLRSSMIFLNSLMVFAVYFLGRNFNEKTGLISAFIIAIFPFHIMASRWVMTDSLAALLICMSLALYLSGIKKNSFLLYGLGGLFLGLSILMKFTSVLVIGVLVVLFFLFKLDFKKIVFSFLCALLSVLPFMIFSKQYFGGYFFIIIKAINAVVLYDPINFIVVIFNIFLFFGFIIFFALINKSKNRKLNYLMLFWLALGLGYFPLLSQRGIAKPEGIEWEMQRFLFPALVPAVILASSFLSRMERKKAYICFFFILLSFIPMYKIAYIPMIGFENGLREVSKEIGIYASENLETDAQILATKNYPSIAYYSGKKTSNKIEELDKTKKIYVMIIEKNSEKINNNALYYLERNGYRATISVYRADV